MLSQIRVHHVFRRDRLVTPLPEAAPRAAWLDFTQCLLDSFRQWTGKELIERKTREEDLLSLNVYAFCELFG